MNENNLVNLNLCKEISEIIISTRNSIRSSVNSAMVIAYWNIGKIIVEDQLKGATRAQYGKSILKDLSEKLTEEFGKGFNIRNLKHMKRFYELFGNMNSVSTQLSWTHYRHLLKVEDSSARNWYMRECEKENWSTRALERQINSFYYDRLLSSKEKEPVITEAIEKLKN